MSEPLTMQGSFNETTPNLSYAQEGVQSFPLDPLSLDGIPDDDLIKVIDKRIERIRQFNEEKLHLYDRRKKNEMYLFGTQNAELEQEKLIKDYESTYNQNVLYEIEGTMKPLAMARLPDLMCLPAYDNEQSVLTAQEVGKVIDTVVKKRENRFVLGLAIKHLPTYFISCIKCRWNPEINDYVFECIHPDLLDIDNECADNDADHMSIISQLVPLSIEQIFLRFPDKKEEFMEQLAKDGTMGKDTPEWALLATILKIREVWFTWYKEHENGEVEKIEGVLWKYKNVILKKMRNPNFDYTGEKRYFVYDTDEKGNQKKRSLNEQELQMILVTGEFPENMKEEQVYHNYFKYPRKPFYFMGYDQWGDNPMDKTSRIEQNIQNQKSLDKRGKQIEETLDNRGHHIFSKGALTPSDVEELDLNAPNLDLSVDGKPSEVHDFIPPERPGAQEFQEKEDLRNRMYAVAHANAVRGEIKDTAATNNQLAREGDFTAADDYVEDTINDAAQWMAEWSMQMVKLRYTEDHWKDAAGVAGTQIWIKLNRNMIYDGMIVKMKASGTDKLRAQNNAMEMAKMQMIDPYTFFVDMGLSDPEGRTEKLILAKADPISYLQKVVKGLNTSEALAKALMNAQLPMGQGNQIGLPQPAQPQNPVMPGAGSPPTGPQQPGAQNTAQVPTAPPLNQPQGVM